MLHEICYYDGMMAEPLQHYLNVWNLTDPQLLAETATSSVYLVSDAGMQVVLKLLKPVGEEERSGAVALRHFDGHGAVRLLRGDREAHLLEYVAGEDLAGLVERGDDDQATAIIGDVLNQLHATSNGRLPDELTPLDVWFRDLFRKADEDRKNGVDSIYTRAAAAAEKLLAHPRDVCVLHGDIHHENIRHGERGWLAFDPKGLIGERTFDAANVLRNPIGMMALVENEVRLLRAARILAQKLDVELSRLLTYTYVFVCLSASWLFYDHQAAHRDLRIAEIVEPHARL